MDLYSEENVNWNELLCEDRIRTTNRSTTSHDLRTEFEKDYHRIISSASFRRLQDKTQVFPLDKSDYIRTRLTHSLEVSSFAKSLGQSVGARIIEEQLDPDFDFQKKEDICNILQCAGLIHDIGNPPFGHFGESAIQDWCKENFPKLIYKGECITQRLTDEQKEDFYNFEGNTQALRVVTKLHFLVDEHGMNLTKALLSTIIKYPVSSKEIDKKCGDIRCKKMGYFSSEKNIFDNIQKSVGTYGKRNPLTFLLEAADDIAYRTADIEDSLKKGCFTYKQLVEELECYGNTLDNNELYNSLIEKLKSKYKTAISRNYEEPDIYAVKNWVVNVQGIALQSVTDSFIKNYDSIMSGEYKKDLFYGSPIEGIMWILGDIAYRYAFTSTPIYKLEIAADNIFNFLLTRFMHAAVNFDTDEKLSTVDTKIISLVSEDYKRIYYTYSKDMDDNTKLYLRLLLVTDYICGMTDSYAKNLYQELNGTL